MTNKEFAKEVKEVLEKNFLSLSEDGMGVLEKMASSTSAENGITEKGMSILGFMYNNIPNGESTFSSVAKVIAEGIGCTGRAVSGSLRKLVTDGFVEKSNNEEGAIVYTLVVDKYEQFLNK